MGGGQNQVYKKLYYWWHNEKMERVLEGTEKPQLEMCNLRHPLATQYLYT